MTPVITFRASVPCAASPAAVYSVLADLQTHLAWSGEQAPNKKFRLLSLSATSAPAMVGDRFSSTGANNFSMTFHDASEVLEAEPGARFGFDTRSRLERRHRPAWLGSFSHRYALGPAGIDYTCEVWPGNYLPWWLQAPMRPMTRIMVQAAIRKNLRNLAAMAEASQRQAHGEA